MFTAKLTANKSIQNVKILQHKTLQKVSMELNNYDLIFRSKMSEEIFLPDRSKSSYLNPGTEQLRYGTFPSTVNFKFIELKTKVSKLKIS